ncbi:hypothetical protein KD33_16775 [Clostridium sp. NCR]|nr:hypothetical protein KD33_16775 [Clostridium sp. NCR]
MSNESFSSSCERVKRQVENQILKNINTACLLLKRDSIKNCPVDQGLLRAAMVHDVNILFGEVIGRVGNTMEYSPYVHQGTGIYAINGDGRKTPWKYEAKSGKYKGWHITVGQKPQPFLESAKIANMKKIQKILGEGLR